MLKKSTLAIGAFLLLLTGVSPAGIAPAHSFILGPDSGKQQQPRSSRNQAPAYSGGVLVPEIIDNQRQRPRSDQNFGSRRPSQHQQMDTEGPIGFGSGQRPSSRNNNHIYGQGSGAPAGRARNEAEIRDQRVQAFRDRQAQRNSQVRQTREARQQEMREAAQRDTQRRGSSSRGQHHGGSPVERSFR
ncbi:MAG: hypothetical protein EA357_12110 [Micavibrio sp.]|jgi:hypothetical protein|nr:MAG: hypothetical protein EA357_12110 [Micavibrio sp.]